jgi:hypothetical protein
MRPAVDQHFEHAALSMFIYVICAKGQRSNLVGGEAGSGIAGYDGESK